MSKLNKNVKEKPIVTALLIAVIIGLICLIIFVWRFYEPQRKTPPIVKVETSDGQVLELNPISYSWFYRGNEQAEEFQFDPNNFDYSNCTVYDSYSGSFSIMKAFPKTKFKKMYKTTYMYNPETGKYEQYENDVNNFERYEQDIFLSRGTGDNSNTFVSVYTMTYNQGRVTYVVKIVQQDNYHLGIVKEYKGMTLEDKDKIMELASHISSGAFLKDVETEEGKLNLIYEFKIPDSATNSVAMALFNVIDNLEEIKFSHQNTEFVEVGFDPEKNQAIRNEIEYTEPRIVTKDSLTQDLNFEWADLKESLGL